MTELVVRRLLVDLETAIPARWNGGDAFRSAFFSALSMSFPVGEQFFIDSVRNGLQTLPEAEQARYAAEVQGFVGQRSTWRSAARLLLSRDGMLRGNYGRWRDYFAPDFHPSQQDAAMSQRWLHANAAQFSVVGQAC